MLFVFLCYSALGITITNGITYPDIKLFGPDDEEIEKGKSITLDDILVSLEYEGRYCRYRKTIGSISSDKTITDDDCQNCINPNQIFCFDIIAENIQVEYTSSYNGRTQSVESGGIHMKVHRQVLHDKEFTVTLSFNKCPELKFTGKSVWQMLPDEQKCVWITRQVVDEVCYGEYELPEMEPGYGPGEYNPGDGDDKPNSSDDGSGEDDKPSSNDDGSGEDDKPSSSDDDSGGDDKPGGGNDKPSSGDESNPTESNPYKFFSLKEIVNADNEKKCKEQSSKIEKLKNECKNVKKGDKRYEDCLILEKMNDATCTLTDKINDELKNVPQNIDLLIILIKDIPTVSINFNQLKGKPIVYLAANTEATTNSLTVIKMLTQKYENRNNTKENENGVQLAKTKPHVKDTTPIMVEGGIEDHVSFLMIGSYDDDHKVYLQVNSKSLNPETLMLTNVDMIGKYSFKVKYLILKGVNKLLYPPDEQVVEQCYYHEPEVNSYVITFENNKVTYQPNGVGKAMEISGILYTTTGIVSTTLQYVLNAGANPTIKPLNITIHDVLKSLPELSAVKSSLVPTLEKQTIKIKSNIPESVDTTNLKISFTFDKNLYQLDKNDLPNKLQNVITENDIFKYVNKKNEDNGDSKSKGPSIGLIVGIAVGVVVVVVIIIVVIVVVVKKKKKVANSEGSASP